MAGFLDALAAHYGGITRAFLLDLVTDYAVFLVAALGLYLLMSAGQVSLGHAGIVGISAYGAGVMAVKLGVPFWLSLPVSGAIGLATGVLYCFLLGWRLGGFYLAIGTFAVGEMLVNLWLTSDYLGGAIGLPGIPLRSRWPLLAAIVAVLLFVLWRLEQSRFGIAFRAVRNNEIVAASMGIDVARTKLLVWMIAGFITGVGGCLHAHRVTVLTPTEFGIYFSVILLMAPLIGGLRSFWGTVVGAAVVSFGPWLVTTNEPRDRLMMYGLGILLLMILRPQGLLAPRRPPAAREAGPTPAAGAVEQRGDQPTPP
jgi:branched-chain amino acid transport system permease protein